MQLRDVISGKKQSGFTLIELLVVIAVIAVLLAILMPALRSAKALTKRMTCQGNLKQIALAWNMYLEENDGRFYQGRNTNLLYGGWSGMQVPTSRPLNHYFNLPVELVEDKTIENEAKIFFCPADRGGVPGYAAQEKAYHFYGTSYQTNLMLVGQDQLLIPSDQFAVLHEEINKRLRNLTLNRVDQHSRLLLIGNYGWINQWKPLPHPREEWKELAEWHGRTDCFNMAFLDSHVELLRIGKGWYVADEYSVVPFEELFGLARELQGQEQLP
jgi:prepilin-type N-terminal cleavage/methylation domain-containing protein/prepilin-type processing-associated H-X9-DG protein